jgi:hypothetical protein
MSQSDVTSNPITICQIQTMTIRLVTSKNNQFQNS